MGEEKTNEERNLGGRVGVLHTNAARRLFKQLLNMKTLKFVIHAPPALIC
jgi:hypothetical protein